MTNASARPITASWSLRRRPANRGGREFERSEDPFAATEWPSADGR